MRWTLLAWLAWMAIACQPQPPRLGTAGAPLVVGYVSSGPGGEGFQPDQELVQLLKERVGLVVELRTFPNAGALVEAIGAGEVHLAWLDPLAYLWGHEKYGVEASLVAIWKGSPTGQGQIIAHADYGIVSLADLKGADFCWLDAPSLTAVVMPRIFLAANGLDPERDLGEVSRVASERELVQAVYDGECQAGATSVDAREAILSEHPDALDKLRVIAKTALIPHQAVGFAADVPAAVRQALTGALLDIAQERGARETLGLEGILPVGDELFNELRAQLAAAGIEIESLMERLSI